MNKLEKVLTKHPKNHSIIRKLYKSDFTNTKKYFPWMVKQFVAGGEFVEITNIIEPFDKYGKNLEKRDIYQYDLETLTKTLQAYCAKRKERLEVLPRRFRMMDNKKWLVVRLDDAKIAQKYGYGGKWCTSMRNPNNFIEYSYRGDRLYIVYNKVKKTKCCVLCNSFTVVFDSNGVDLDWEEAYYEDLISRQIVKMIESDKWKPFIYLLRNATKKDIPSVKRKLRQKLSEHQFEFENYFSYLQNDVLFQDYEFVRWCYTNDLLSKKKLAQHGYKFLTYTKEDLEHIIEKACNGKTTYDIYELINNFSYFYNRKEITKIENRILAANPHTNIVGAMAVKWSNAKKIKKLLKTKHNRIVLRVLEENKKDIIKYIDYFKRHNKTYLLRLMSNNDLKEYIRTRKPESLPIDIRSRILNTLPVSKQMRIIKELVV